jgi:hypothetical protein
VPRYQRLYRGAYAPADYAGAVTARVAKLARAYGIGARATRDSRLERPPAEPAVAATQLALL